MNFREELRQVLGGSEELTDDRSTTASAIKETDETVLGVSSGQRTKNKETW